MKNKLQALIAEQKALTAKFEELLEALHSTTEESSTLDPKKVYIKGHPTRGAEVIKILEDLGGVNKFNWDGTRSWIIYRIRHEDNVILSTAIEDLRYTPCNIELHLPEEVSEENAQTTDIKVGDWIWVDNIPTSNTIDCDIRKIIHHNPHKVVEINKDGDICFDVAGESMFINPLEGDKFHKVDPPKEEVELIEGEVYNVFGNIVIFKNKGANILHTLSIYRKDGTLCTDETNGYAIDFKGEWIIATPEQRKQLFDALEKAGKCFDKENMRLLDVEEFTLKDGDPFICKMNGRLSVEVFSYHKEPFGVVSYNNYTCTPLLPFNDQTKHLIGTTDSPDKYYKFVEK